MIGRPLGGGVEESLEEADVVACEGAIGSPGVEAAGASDWSTIS
jgi:hypothetical protein